MINKFSKLLYGFFTFLPLIITLFTLPIIPEQTPAHYNLAGEITRWGSKYELLLMPIISLVTGVLFYFLTRKYAKHNYKMYFYTGLGLLILFGGMSCFFLYNAINNIENVNDVNFYGILTLIIGFIYIIIGNILPKCQSNKLIGFRTKWTLASPDIWKKTHRLTGRLFMLAGIIQMVFSIILSDIYLFITLVVLSCSIVVIGLNYSYYLYKLMPQ